MTHENKITREDIPIKEDKIAGLLRSDQKVDSSKTGLLRRLESGNVFSKTPKESNARHFLKAYVYRLYTSVGITPMIAMITLSMKDHYHLTNTKAAFLQGGVEFIIKPFTYAFFEWGASHIKMGYKSNTENSKNKIKEQDSK